VLDQILAAFVMKTAGKSRNQIDRSIRRAKQQRPGIRRYQSAVKGSFHSPAFNHSQSQLFCAALCRDRG
jgi:hypothetical protein